MIKVIVCIIGAILTVLGLVAKYYKSKSDKAEKALSEAKKEASELSTIIEMIHCADDVKDIIKDRCSDIAEQGEQDEAKVRKDETDFNNFIIDWNNKL